MPSDKQRTGPRTPAGKAQSSLNALRHGLRARSAVLPGESRAAFSALLRGFVAHYRPADTHQHLLVEQMAIAYWKLARISRIEALVFRTRSADYSGLLPLLRELLPRHDDNGNHHDDQPEPPKPPPSPDELLARAFMRDTSGANTFARLSPAALTTLLFFGILTIWIPARGTVYRFDTWVAVLNWATCLVVFRLASQAFASPEPRHAFRRSLLYFGFGLGTWSTVYPAYAPFDPGLFANHAHNDWAEWAAEGGLPFAALLLSVAVWSVLQAARFPWGLGGPAFSYTVWWTSRCRIRPWPRSLLCCSERWPRQER